MPNLSSQSEPNWSIVTNTQGRRNPIQVQTVQSEMDLIAASWFSHGLYYTSKFGI